MTGNGLIELTDKNIEVFQNLHLKGRTTANSVRASILTHVKERWHHNLEGEEDIRDWLEESARIKAQF